MKPPIPITDPRFIYTDAANTDIRVGFARVRRGLTYRPERQAEKSHLTIFEQRRKVKP